MTIQTKNYIDLADITTFRFDCKNCGATLSFPVSDTRAKLALDQCPNCRATWALRPGLSHSEIILQFRDVLKRLQTIMGEDYPDPLNFTMKLEVNPDAAPQTLQKTV